jgi:predicted nucleic acid-binding protein
MEAHKISIDEYIKGIALLDIDEQLTLLEVISARIKKSIIKKRNKNSIMELEGLGADIWKGIEAQEYVNFVDGQIVAIAKVNDLILVTRNTSDYKNFDAVTVQNWHIQY